MEMDTQRAESAATPAAETLEASAAFIGQWNRLVSTTNWEKGRIIFAWRTALAEGGAPAAEYSDEAWCALVSGVTPQHVGRLRRVYQRFGDAHQQYPGLYWSHFQAAIDWDDAEMWLEGAVQNGWSISQMRQQRSDTLSLNPGEAFESEGTPVEMDEDGAVAYEGDDSIARAAETRTSGGTPEATSEAAERGEHATDDEADNHLHEAEDEAPEESAELVRPFASLRALPEDLLEAFDGLKLAILRHKADDWSQVSPEDVVAHLGALQQLISAPSD